MQAPQILGMLIGAALMGLGLLFWSIQKDNKRTWVRLLSVIAFYFGILSVAQNAMFSYASTWSWEGVFYVWAGLFGQALAPIIFSFLGCLYRPNRAAGYAVMLVIFTGLIMLGNA